MRRTASCLLPALAVPVLLSLGCQPRPAATPAKPASDQTGAQGSGGFDEQAVASFYRGKTLRIVVGFAPGGGFDTYARAVGRHINRHIPGSPTVIVENMPGAGSLIAANNVYAAARPDGLTIGHWIGGLILQQLLGAPGHEFDARKYRYLGAPTPDNVVCAVRKDAGYRTIPEAVASQQPVILGGTAAGSNTDDAPKALAAALGFNLRLISGYSGTSTIRQAADGGEVHGGCWGWESIKVTWKSGLDSGDVIPILQAGHQKLRDLPNVDFAPDIARTDEARQLIMSGVVVPGRIQRPFAVHPNTPEDRLQALRRAFLATLADPQFLEDAQKATLDVDPIPGDEYEKLVDELFQTPEPVKERLKSILLS